MSHADLRKWLRATKRPAAVEAMKADTTLTEALRMLTKSYHPDVLDRDVVSRDEKKYIESLLSEVDNG